MKPSLTSIALTLALAAGTAAMNAQTYPHTNEQSRKEAAAQARQDRKADKAQANADKKAHKALKSDKVKDAARAQDKADAEAAKTTNR